MRLGISWLDIKLGIRMLARYPGLSFAGGLAIAMVVVCGTVAGIFDAVVNGMLPFEDGDRIVAIENWDTSGNEPAVISSHDFDTWRIELKTIRDVGAYRLVRRNVAAAGVPAEPVRIAEISAAAFRVARVQPLLGRFLIADDEAEEAAAAIVIGYDEWQRRFGGDPRVIGLTADVGGSASTVVGVMPKGFGFPVNDHYWIPLRLKRSDNVGAQRPSSMPYKSMPNGVLHIFGRLADSADLESARAELAVLGQRAAVDFPDTHSRIRPRVLPYARWFFDEQHDGETLLLQTLVTLLLGVVGANVAVLVYARTATRRIEIALRSALGASRGRIVGQMFAEGLALSSAAAAIGLLAAGILRRQLDTFVRWEQAPFWVDTSVTSATVIAYVLTLAVLGAVIVGVILALQVTSRRAQSGLQHAAANASGWRIGRTYGVLIVIQVALAVSILPFAITSAWSSIRDATSGAGFPANEFLTARVDTEHQIPSSVLNERLTELARRLESEPGVLDVTFLNAMPGNEPPELIEVEGEGSVREVKSGRIGIDFVGLFDVPIVAGRAFDSRDTDQSSRHVIVNRTFAQTILDGNALGRQVRRASSPDISPGPWLEIVGVVADFPATRAGSSSSRAAMYQPVDRGFVPPALLAVRVRGSTPAAFASRLREVTMALDPQLQLRDVRTMDAVLRDQQIGARVGAWASGLITLSLLLLSATGLYALMSFTVTQRRREIGIRVALGANAHRLLASIFSRALGQLAIGIVLGVAIAALIDTESGGELTGGAGLGMLAPVAVFVLMVGLIAAAGPARRGLSIQPSEALKEQ